MTSLLKTLSLRQKLIIATSITTIATLTGILPLPNGPNFNLPPSPTPNSGKSLIAAWGLSNKKFDKDAMSNTRNAKPTPNSQAYYQEIYNEIAKKLIDNDNHDDGSFGPLLVRLAWHNSGSYDQNDQTDTKGGSFAGTMRFKKEQKDPENAGLKLGMEFLNEFIDKYEISHGDLYTLGGVVAIQEMSGPKIKWRPGRFDLNEGVTPPYHRLPDASKETGEYVREVFQKRLGFSDKEIVCLIGVGHGIGRCHTYNSGFDGPWTFSPITVTNQFFKLLLSEDWKEKKWSGKRQYEDENSHSLMMLPTDMVLKDDSNFLKYVKEYAEDEDKCMKDFSLAFTKLLERGIHFESTPRTFQTLEEQGL